MIWFTFALVYSIAFHLRGRKLRSVKNGIKLQFDRFKSKRRAIISSKAIDNKENH